MVRDILGTVCPFPFLARNISPSLGVVPGAHLLPEPGPDLVQQLQHPPLHVLLLLLRQLLPDVEAPGVAQETPALVPGHEVAPVPDVVNTDLLARANVSDGSQLQHLPILSASPS